MHYKFNDVLYEHGLAHHGKEPIYFSRVVERSSTLIFNFIDLVIVPVGADIGMHTHERNNQEIYVIISGKGEMIVNGQIIQIASGDVVVNPIGGTHSLKNTGAEDMKLVVVESPIERK